MKEPVNNLNDLESINRNANGDYYFIFKVNGVRNTINTKAKSRDEVLIVGVPQKKLVSFLKGLLK